MSFDNYSFQKSDSADTTESNFGTSISGDGGLRPSSFVGSQNSGSQNRSDLSPTSEGQKISASMNQEAQYDLYGGGKSESNPSLSPVHWQQQQSSASTPQIPSLGEASGNSFPSLTRSQTLGISSPNKYGANSYPWAPFATPSSATNNFNSGSAASRDLWSSTAASASAGMMTSNTSTSSNPTKLQSKYYPGADPIFNSFYDTSATSAPLATSSSLSHADMDTLAMQLMQLNLPKSSSNLNTFNGPSKVPSFQNPAEYGSKWPSFSGQSTSPSAHIPPPIDYNSRQQLTHEKSRSVQLTNADSGDMNSEIENDRVQLELKNSIITKLENENSRLKMVLKVSSNKENDNSPFEIPKNHEQLYNKLAEKLQATQDELEDTKLRLEVILTAIALNPNQSVTKTGRYDEEEIAHKVITKMQMLTEENEEMAKMLSYGKSKEKDIEIGLLRKQNTELKTKISKLETKVKELKKAFLDKVSVKPIEIRDWTSCSDSDLDEDCADGSNGSSISGSSI
ncbi:hypothetical protein OGAPHI_003600 [Ogataea philodendri]|uniref:Mum2p n=1 Tax=Ogataea philodendri TaxID=1378263 RepID=A0A9P8T460_9ASCO|nr:uncharacterized protein OGAPHI_003600 [Ogataea philodendri]KAH3665416.1 hypothetical protein OGAPHI_003600 [Ogataea philodendri]